MGGDGIFEQPFELLSHLQNEPVSELPASGVLVRQHKPQFMPVYAAEKNHVRQIMPKEYS
ncbi:MAG: hypothetical protein LUD47_04370 [Clostridia bacterium]|nr:hypothetical protein [Clostridia bacterium]